MPTTTAKTLHDLNDAQLWAVTTDAKRVLALAGAGTGKTRALTRRAAHLVRECGYSPHDILVVTFTNKAAAEMKTRIAELIGENESAKMRIGTFHSLALWICNQWAEKLGLVAKISIYDADDQADIIKFLIKKKHKCKLSPRKIIEAMEGRCPDAKIRDSGIIEEYHQILRDSNALDFRSMLIAAETLLMHDEIRDHYHNKFPHALIDEFQDTNPVQMRIINAIDPENLFVVGDDYQSIYGFRGADVGVMWDFSEREGVEVIRLVENYRSYPQIIEAANNLISHNTEQLHKRLIPMRVTDLALYVSDLRFPTTREEAEFITSRIGHNIKGGNTLAKDIAILGRTHRHLRKFTSALSEAGIPFQRISGKDIWSTEPARILVAFLKVIRNPADNWSMGYILRVLVKLTALDHNALETMRTEKLLTLLEAAEKQAQTGTPIRDVVDFITEMQDRITSASWAIEHLIFNVPLVAMYHEHHLDTKVGQFQEVLEAVRDWEEHTEGSTGYGDFLDWLSGRMMQDRIREDLDAVTVATVHAAKGLEWPVVYGVGVHEGGFPYSKAHEEREIAEERRLMYVLITRAKDVLIVTVPGEDAYGRRVDESRFIGEMKEAKTNDV